MQHQLLWIEIVGKLAVGLPLLLVPGTLLRALGLPGADAPLWPRLLGAMLIGLALASGLEMRWLPGRAMGLAGSVAVNLTVAALLGSQLILGGVAGARRGRLALWAAAVALTLLALVEIVSAL